MKPKTVETAPPTPKAQQKVAPVAPKAPQKKVKSKRAERVFTFQGKANVGGKSIQTLVKKTKTAVGNAIAAKMRHRLGKKDDPELVPITVVRMHNNKPVDEADMFVHRLSKGKNPAFFTFSNWRSV